MDHVIEPQFDVNAHRALLKSNRLELESAAETLKMLSQHPNLTPRLLEIQLGGLLPLLEGVLYGVRGMAGKSGGDL